MKTKPKIATTATGALRILWEEGFFRSWKKISEIDQVLGKRDHHFPSRDLGMALQRAKYLTRRGKRGGYEYIQKHPFIREEKE